MHEISDDGRRNGFFQHFDNMGVRGGVRNDIAAEAGGEHHRQIGTDFKYPFGQLHARHARHG